MSAPVEEEKAKHLTPAQWAEIVTLWELGETTLETLQSRFGISMSGLSKGLRSRGATKGSRAHEIAAVKKKAVLAAVEESTLTAEQERQQKISETRKQHYDWAKAISAQTFNCIVRAARAEKPVETELDNIKALRQAMATLSLGRMERFAVLNADEDMGEGELPTLQIQDLSADEIADLRKSDDNDDAVLEELDPAADIVSET